MAVLKEDGNVILRGDYHRTVNPALEIDQYPLPHPEDLMAALTGGHKFSKMDLSAANQQMILDEDSQPYMVINTQKGVFKYLGLPFGVTSTPLVSQQTMDIVLK